MVPSYVSTFCAIRYDLINAFIIAMYNLMCYSLLMPDLVAFYAKLNEIQTKIILRWKFLSVYVFSFTHSLSYWFVNIY